MKEDRGFTYNTDTKEWMRARIAFLESVVAQANVALLNAPAFCEGEQTYARWFDGQRLAAQRQTMVIATYEDGFAAGAAAERDRQGGP